MSILTREEFGVLIVHHTETLVAFGQARTASGVHMLHDQAEASGRRVMAAYDAALARIAELEAIHGKAFALAPGAHEVIAECSTWHDGCHCTSETLAHNIKRADEAEAALKSPAYRARIAREFRDEVSREPIDFNSTAAPRHSASEQVLARWEAAAKEKETC